MITYEPQTPTPQPIDKEDIILDDRCIGEMSKDFTGKKYVCTLFLTDRSKITQIREYGAGDTKKEALNKAVSKAKQIVTEATNTLAWIEMRI